MAFLRSINPLETWPAIHAITVYLRSPQMSDFDAWSSLREQSRTFLTPWEPTWPRDDLTRPAFRRRLRRYYRDMREDEAYPFFVFRTDNDELAGGLTLSNVRRGVAQSCSMGYWIGARHARQGLMGAAVSAITPFVFDTLRLHRLEAACIPTNTASVRLLEKAGFTREGLARRYLRINGAWQDHVLYALLADDAVG